MFIRNVKLPNGSVADQHEVRSIEHHLGSDTIVNVLSSRSSDGAEFWSSMSYGFDDTLTFTEAEEWVMELPQFEEYIDEAQQMIDILLPTLTDEQAAQVPGAFAPWAVDISYTVGTRISYEGVVYKCLQAHTSQEGWEPGIAASLWAALLIPDPIVIPEWVQPDSTNPYMTGDKVTHNGQTWESSVDNNVWEPGVYGWVTI